jgi:hypothetical protein
MNQKTVMNHGGHGGRGGNHLTPALSRKLEREPKSDTIQDQSVSITLSTRLWGERDGVRGVSPVVNRLFEDESNNAAN